MQVFLFHKAGFFAQALGHSLKNYLIIIKTLPCEWVKGREAGLNWSGNCTTIHTQETAQNSAEYCLSKCHQSGCISGPLSLARYKLTQVRSIWVGQLRNFIYLGELTTVNCGPCILYLDIKSFLKSSFKYLPQLFNCFQEESYGFFFNPTRLTLWSEFTCLGTFPILSIWLTASLPQVSTSGRPPLTQMLHNIHPT